MNVLLRATAAAVLAAAFAAQALAGGDDYDAENDTEGKGPAYFGFVRDTRGSPVSDAQVMLRPKKGDPVVLKSNAIGLYRSHVTKEVNPDDVEVSCDKAGYKQTRVARRAAAGTRTPCIETNCTLQRL